MYRADITLLRIFIPVYLASTLREREWKHSRLLKKWEILFTEMTRASARKNYFVQVGSIWIYNSAKNLKYYWNTYRHLCMKPALL